MNDFRSDVNSSEHVDEKQASSSLSANCLHTSCLNMSPQSSHTPCLQPLIPTPCYSPSPSENHIKMNDNSIDARKWTPQGSPPNRPQGSPRRTPEQLKALADSSRYWENVKTSNKQPTNNEGLPFTVLNYNILAQTLLEGHSYLYQQCDMDDLKWTVRFKRITCEISAIKPDIICLQEVQDIHSYQILSHLDQLGYEGIFKQKTGTREDGCAIYFRKSMFELAQCESVEFLQPEIDLLNRDNIGLMIKLRPLSLPDSLFVVCTTHLLYNPRRDDVRLAQMQVFLAEIDRFSFQSNANNRIPTHLPIIMTGDFNSVPVSPVTALVADGNYNLDQFPTNLQLIQVTSSCQHLGVYLQRNKDHDVKSSMLYNSEIQQRNQASYRNMERIAKDYAHLFNNSFVRHNLNFKSVYNHMKKDGEYEATTFQETWVTVDYIYYSSGPNNTLQVLQRFRLPTVGECQNMGAIPNSHFGSDHLSLAAKFILTCSPPDSPNADVSGSS